MSNLKKIKFNEFITLQRGFDLPRKDMNAGPYPAIGSTSIIGYHDEYKVEPPGVITGRSGSLGVVQYISVKYWPHNTALWVKDFKGNYPRYVYYFLQTLDLQRFNSGAGVPTLNRNDMDDLDLAVHPIPIQEKVASILSSYDDLIENNNRRIKILEEMAQAIYKEWFINFRFPGHKKVRMVKSKLGMIPEGWEINKLSDIVETQYGYTESASNEEIGPKFLRGMDINKNSYIDWSAVPYCKIHNEEYERYKLQEGDILVIRMADPGKVGIVEEDVDAVFASYLIRLKIVTDNILPYYLFHFLLSDRYQDYIKGASTGTTRKSASAGVVTGIDVMVPSKSISGKFEADMSIIRKQLCFLLEKNAILRKTRDLLLPKLISGEINVAALDINTKGLEA